MNIKDIKVGETLLLPITVTHAYPTGWVEAKSTPNNEYMLPPAEVEILIPKSGQQNNLTPTGGEQKPQYDPCRKFRKGDKVRLKQVNGRDFNGFAVEKKKKILSVLRDEEPHCNVFLSDPIGDDFTVDPAYLELVSPVEELEPYSVETCQYGYTVNKGEKILSTYNDECHPHAYEAAKAECDRLNAEHRKEMEK